jgi:hypothetical protein
MVIGKNRINNICKGVENMTMEKGERAIIAGFRTMAAAEQAGKQLKDLGTIDMSIDRIGEHPATKYERRPENPITGDYPGLAIATFDREMSRDSSILASVDPSASGMSDGNEADVGIDVTLTVVVSDKKFDQAEKIVRKHGGRF